MQISFAVTAKLISAFVFATRIVQFLFFLNPKFQASNHLLCLFRPVCGGPGRKPRRLVFSRRGSLNLCFRKPTISVSDQVQFKPGYTVTENSLKLETSDLEKKEVLYYLSSKNEDADQLCSYCTADLICAFFLSMHVFGFLYVGKPVLDEGLASQSSS